MTEIAFAGSPLDRASAQRSSDDWVSQQADRDDARYLVYWRLQTLLKSGEVFGVAWANKEIRSTASADPGAVLLGMSGEVPYLAVDVTHLEKPEHELGLSGVASFAELRSAALTLPSEESAIVAHGRSLLDWHSRHRFCPACGEVTGVAHGGAQRICTGCDVEHFPRLNPVAIMAVVREQSCLVGRGRGWPAGMYSALAGFIEPGETLEETVRREVLEEVGVRVDRVDYIASQPWPFPAQLMLGCIAHAHSRKITIDPKELEDARWVDRDDIIGALEKRPVGISLPPPTAIAHQLLKHWARS